MCLRVRYANIYLQLGVSAANMAPDVFDIIRFAVHLLDSRDAVN